MGGFGAFGVGWEGQRTSVLVMPRASWAAMARTSGCGCLRKAMSSSRESRPSGRTRTIVGGVVGCVGGWVRISKRLCGEGRRGHWGRRTRRPGQEGTVPFLCVGGMGVAWVWWCGCGGGMRRGFERMTSPPPRLLPHPFRRRLGSWWGFGAAHSTHAPASTVQPKLGRCMCGLGSEGKEEGLVL